MFNLFPPQKKNKKGTNCATGGRRGTAGCTTKKVTNVKVGGGKRKGKVEKSQTKWRYLAAYGIPGLSREINDLLRQLPRPGQPLQVTLSLVLAIKRGGTRWFSEGFDINWNEIVLNCLLAFQGHELLLVLESLKCLLF